MPSIVGNQCVSPPSRSQEFFAIVTCSLSRTLPRLCFGSNSHARPRSSNAFPPSSGFGLPLRISKAARTAQRAEILRRNLRKCFSVGCPRLTSAWEWRPLAPGRPRHMGTKGNNMNLNRVELIGLFRKDHPEGGDRSSGTMYPSLASALRWCRTYCMRVRSYSTSSAAFR